MLKEIGDKVMVDGEECEVVSVYGGREPSHPVYAVKTPDGTLKKVHPEQIGEVEEEEELEPEGGGEGEGEGELEPESELEPELEPGKETTPGEEEPPSE